MTDTVAGKVFFIVVAFTSFLLTCIVGAAIFGGTGETVIREAILMTFAYVGGYLLGRKT
jgi:hypothetical protein